MLCVLPTGYGKSMSYILPPLILNEIEPDKKHMALVISPLKSLMLDQHATLKTHGISSMALHQHKLNHLSLTEEIVAGEVDVLFMSPEAAVSNQGKNLLTSQVYTERLVLLACDEAHCLSKWGKDFRQAYTEILVLRSLLDSEKVCTMALTATITDDVRKDIFRTLAFDEDTSIIAMVPDRPSIILRILQKSENFEKELEWISDLVKKYGSNTPKILIYTRSLAMCGKVHDFLLDEAGEDALYQDSATDSGTTWCPAMIDMYHASNTIASQERILEEFPKPESKIRCVVATIAFGMGVQIPDVRLVVHWGVPDDALSYWQEIGRGGRDGKKSLALLYAYPRSICQKYVSKEMKDMVRKSGAECTRKLTLQQLTCHGMDTSSLSNIGKSPSCSADVCSTGHGVCICKCCSCCQYCASKCVCPSNVTDVVDLVHKLFG